MRLLYVEDDPLDAFLVAQTLRDDPLGYQVDLATSLESARARLLERTDYELVLTDLGLPDGSGLELVAEIRERQLAVPVIVLTGSDDADTIIAALAAGADDYQVKSPGHEQHLRATLDGALARFRAERVSRPSTLRLLYAQSDPLAAQQTRDHLERHAPNLRLEVVASTEALERRVRVAKDSGRPYDVLLVECRLAGDASLGVLRTLLDEGQLPGPVVMLGGEGDEQLAGHALRLGARVHYLVKHANYLYALPATVENAYRTARLVREAATLREVEAQLRQSHKMEAIGQLAGGVAHDFNNMLGVILGHVELGLGKAGALDPLRRNLEEINAAAMRSADLTGQLLAFARRSSISPKALDLGERVTGMERMLRRLIGEDVDLDLEVARPLWPVLVDPSQVDQLVANLVINARDAMPEGGRMRLKVACSAVEAVLGAANGVPAGDYLLLELRDTGTGMDQHTLEHAMEPFFTTKGEGKGTGLGLSTVYGIARQNGGFLMLESEVGRGTTASVYLPRYCGTLESPQESVPQATRTGHETILLVEDEASLRELLQEVLTGMGYSILAAADANAALTLCETFQGRIDLLLTDLVMPRMDGRELAKRVKGLRPEIKVIYMSGYTANVLADRGSLGSGASYLEKPFRAGVLARSVRAALDGSRVSPA